MSSPSMKKISGKLVSEQGAQLQFPYGITIEFTSPLTGTFPGGWIGSAAVSALDGTFELLTTYNLSASEEVVYSILNGKEEIQTGSVTIVNFDVTITVTDVAYQDMQQPDSVGYTTIKGKVILGTSNVPAIPVNPAGIEVTVSKVGFRSEEVLGRGKIDTYGYYEIKIPKRLLQPEHTIGTSCTEPATVKLVATVYNITQAPPILVSEKTYTDSGECCITADLRISDIGQYTLFRAELDYLINTLKLTTGIDNTELYTVTIDGEQPELPRLAAASGLDEAKVLVVVQAAKITQVTGIVMDHTYALTNAWGGSLDAWTILDFGTVQTTILDARDQWAIKNAGDINATYTKLIENRNTMAGAVDTDGGSTLTNALNAIISDENTVKTFLGVDMDYPDATPEVFWDRVQQVLPDQKATLQKGMQVLALTGMQPETIKELLLRVGGNPIRNTAVWTRDQWLQLVTDISTKYGRDCIPPAIVEQAAANGTDPRSDYADKLNAVSKDIFTPAFITSRMRADGDFAATFGDYAAEVASFFEDKPDIDLRYQNIWDVYQQAESYVGGDKTVEAFRDTLLPLQNMMRLTGGKPEGVIALIKGGIRSSADIAAQPMEDFTTNYSAILGSDHIAEQVFNKSTQTAALVSQLQVQYNPSNIVSGSPVLATIEDVLWETFLGNPGTSQSPDLQTLFGSMDLCSCSECMSMYSPAAYYTDILNFMKTKLVLSNSTKAYNELKRRRPDLLHIDLSCKNANTALPYVDLVNELLEMMILKKDVPGASIPLSYQTTCTAKELDAYPEHTKKVVDPVTNVYSYEPSTAYQEVYNSVLKNAVYPNNIPLDLPVEESRVYLTHLGYKRETLLEQFKPLNSDVLPVSSSAISEYNRLNEALGISKKEADIISGIGAVSPWLYYNMSQQNGAGVLWYNQLTNVWPGNPPADNIGLELLLERTGITYSELLQVLNTNFLNPKVSADHRAFEIIYINASSTSNDQDICDLKKLKIIYNTTPATDKPTFFTQLHRFIRLYRATGWRISQLDMVLASFNATSLNDNTYKQVARTYRMAQKLNIAPEKLCAFWSGLNITSYINFNSDSQQSMPSLYDSLFLNKSVINQPNQDFEHPENWPPTLTYNEAYKGTIMAAANIGEEEMVSLFTYVNSPATPTALSLPILSRVYALSLLAQALNLSIKDMLRLNALFELSGIMGGSVDDQFGKLAAMVTAAESLKGQVFTLDEIEYLVAHRDPQAAFKPLTADITLFYSDLRAELKKATSVNVLASLDSIAIGNIILRKFSTAFNLATDMVSYLLQDVLEANSATDLFLYDALGLESFINSTIGIEASGSVPEFGFSALFDAYTRLNKIALIVNKLKLSPEEFRAIQLPVNTTVTPVIPGIDAFQFPAFQSLPVVETAAPAAGMQAMLRLSDWIKVRDMLVLSKDELTDLWKEILLVNGSVALDNLIDMLAMLAGWDPDDLQFLAGSGNILALSNTSPAHFVPGALYLQLSGILEACDRIGLAAQLVYNVLDADVLVADSQRIRQAAKSKHNDDEWQKIAKPLQDALREKQRKALVAYVVARPDIADFPGNTNGTKWKNENELYAYLLIDVEMKPCMKTSRLKQGISSLQLFMDRVILNLENVNGNTGNHIYITPEQTEQWNTWRKWYRIWEANRKIFLYPENWIEPELRDDKTPFFRELETQILQDDITDSTAEDALRQYLERLDEVARLEPVSAYHETEKDNKGNLVRDIMHVIARTQNHPQRYFYRKLEDNIWSPWEKVTVDVKGDHVTPVVWNRRMYLFWLTFTKKDMKREPGGVNLWVSIMDNRNTNTGSVMTITQDANENDLKFSWDVRLSWTQQKEGKWLATEISDDTMNLFPWRLPVPPKSMPSFSVSGSTYTTMNGYFRKISDNGELSLAEVFKNRLYLTANFNDRFGPDCLALSVSLFAAPDESAVSLDSFVFADSSSKPYVLRYAETGDQVLSPLGTRANKMKFDKVLVPEVNNASGKLKVGGLKKDNDQYFSYTYGWWYTDPNGMLYYPYLKQDPSKGEVLLDRTGNFRLTKLANSGDFNLFTLRENPTMKVKGSIDDAFFFEDDKSTFFVQRKDIVSQAVSLVGMATATIGTTNSFAGIVYGAGSSSAATNAGIPVGGSMPPFQVLPDHYYYFQTFYHAQIRDFMKSLNKDGIPGLLQISNQNQTDNIVFGTPGQGNGNYKPTNLVHSNVPKSNVQFLSGDAYSIYNWELFFHAPMLIAQRLSDNQRFDEAQKWYHYIFNPTSSTGMNNVPLSGKERFWKFYPFYKEAQGVPQTLQELMAQIAAQVNAAVNQVKQWEKNPFQPHAIARLRTLAYMKNVVMKYLDNLIAWGDQLFRRDTIESINEGTQLYILAANILGKRPENVPPRVKRKDHTFQQLLDANNGTLDTFSNGMVNIEAFFSPNTGIPTGTTTGTPSGAPVYGKMSYFCLPKNDKLLSYWDTVADRLFKIRNCMNIEGTVRQLPLYEPPIDPALLVKAKAMGVDIDSLLDIYSNNTPVSRYRFSYMLQKANEFCSEVRGLGSSLLSALEKKDAEDLSLLRSGQEIQLLEKISFIKEMQVQEAQANLEALQLTRDNTQQRYDYYNSRPYMNAGEQKQLQSIQDGLILNGVQAGLEGTIGVLSLIPTFHAQGLATGPSFGGRHLAGGLKAASAAVGIAALINNTQGSVAGTKGSYDRRMDDWKFQVATAQKELEQLDRQILASELRLNNMQRELENHELQLDNTRETDSFMRSKFTNKELYSWMATQVAATYFQSYQLAYDMAKRAEACYTYELAEPKTPVGGFITFGYWDSLRKGLMSGEKLQFDLRKMEASYQEQNKRELELTRNISLALNKPDALLQLRQTGKCSFTLPEELFDLDYPGHYMRRIKSVSLSLPCIAGPYTTVAATLSLDSSKLRRNGNAGGTLENDTDAMSVTSSMATSSAQNDSGVFELNFRDERYLPFEGRGAIESAWTLTLAHPNQVRMFDFDTLSDAILHIRYTANEGSEGLRSERISNINSILQSTGAGLNGKLLPRYFSLKHEYSSEWHTYVQTFSQNNFARLQVSLDTEAFPYFCKGQQIKIDSVNVQLSNKTVLSGGYKLKLGYFNTAGAFNTAECTLPDGNGKYAGTVTFSNLAIDDNTKVLQLSLEKNDGTLVDMDELLNDLYLVAYYHTAPLSGTAPGDDTPQIDMPLSQLAGWWKADAINNTVDVSKKIISLRDQSGNNVDLAPYTTGNGPLLATVNGKKVMSFTNNSLYDASHVNSIGGTDDFTICYVGNSCFGRGLDSGSNFSSIKLDNNGVQAALTQSTAVTLNANVTVPVTADHIWISTLDQATAGTNSVLKVLDKSGTLLKSAAADNRSLKSTVDIGYVLGLQGTPTGYVNGNTYEVLVYRKVLNAQELGSVLYYLRGKYPFAV